MQYNQSKYECPALSGRVLLYISFVNDADKADNKRRTF